jgi:uncharacterized protein
VSAILSTFERLIDTITAEAHRLYGTRLECLAVFGSVGRGTMRADSDIDLLVVVEPLPNGRLARIEEFAPVETAVAPLLEQVRTVGVDTRISAVIRTPAEVRAGSPLMFDMTEDARILYDPRAVLRDALDDLGGNSPSAATSTSSPRSNTLSSRHSGRSTTPRSSST